MFKEHVKQSIIIKRPKKLLFWWSFNFQILTSPELSRSTKNNSFFLILLFFINFSFFFCLVFLIIRTSENVLKDFKLDSHWLLHLSSLKRGFVFSQLSSSFLLFSLCIFPTKYCKLFTFTSNNSLEVNANSNDSKTRFLINEMKPALI